MTANDIIIDDAAIGAIAKFHPAAQAAARMQGRNFDIAAGIKVHLPVGIIPTDDIQRIKKIIVAVGTL